MDTNSNLSLFTHVYIDNHASKTLFLLHGTGGDEQDLLFFDAVLGHTYNVVGLRGNVSDDGLLRFFRRFEIGTFDQDNIREETKKLSDFIQAWSTVYATPIEQMIFLGYSNGANMVLATLIYYPNLIKHAVLLHPMLPFTVAPKSVDLSTHSVVVSLGKNDQMIPESQGRAVIEALKLCDATVSVFEYPTGHEITQKEIMDICQALKI